MIKSSQLRFYFDCNLNRSGRGVRGVWPGWPSADRVTKRPGAAVNGLAWQRLVEQRLPTSHQLIPYLDICARRRLVTPALILLTVRPLSPSTTKNLTHTNYQSEVSSAKTSITLSLESLYIAKRF